MPQTGNYRYAAYHDNAKATLTDVKFEQGTVGHLAHGWLDLGDRLYTYSFQNFFHPRIGHLRALINKSGIEGLFDPHVLDGMTDPGYFDEYYDRPSLPQYVGIYPDPAGIDLKLDQPYANYNWELLYHTPLTIAVHLSNDQRFAEAHRWLKFILDPGGTGPGDPVPDRFWRFPAFRTGEVPHPIVDQIELLAEEESQLNDTESLHRQALLNALAALKEDPLNPYAAARAFNTRSFQWLAAFKMLDNLIAWGDYYFTQDTMETLDLARQRYVWAANLLGPRPQRIRSPMQRRPMSYAELRQAGLDEMGNALVELETSLPFNVLGEPAQNGDGNGNDQPLMGLGRTLYFCMPPNDRLLRYWDIVADRLFKIRHCMNIKGVVRPLALFEPPLDPNMLIKAAAAGLSISSIVAGLHKPPSPVRARRLLTRAIELAGELRTFGQALSTALERGDAEALAILRTSHERSVAELQKEARFISWKQSQAATEALLQARKTAWLRYTHAARLVGFEIDEKSAPEAPMAIRSPLTEDAFDQLYRTLVDAFDTDPTSPELPPLVLAEGRSASQAGGNEGTGPLYLNQSEDRELNEHLLAARDFALSASFAEMAGPILAMVPDFNVDLHYWGLGTSMNIFGGQKLATAATIAAQISRTKSAWERDQASIAARTSGFERRGDEWVQQVQTTASEMKGLGRQIITSLIAEEVARHEYEIVKKQLDNNQEVYEHLRSKFTNEELYTWMQGEARRLFYEHYRLSLDVARRAERAVKAEAMTPALDSTTYVNFNHWDGGRKGLMSADRLLMDLRRLEDAYDEQAEVDKPITVQVSLRQLDPIALLQLKTTGACQVTVPEWFYDLHGAGHYMRRIRRVEVSLDPVISPQTPVTLTLSLINSSVRTSPLAGDDYTRQPEDPRFVDYTSHVETIVTSNGVADRGHEQNPNHPDRKGPFEGAGANSTWQMSLPSGLRLFDYHTLTDVTLSITYTYRLGGGLLTEAANTRTREILEDAAQSEKAFFISLRHDQSADWAAFRSGNADFPVSLNHAHFPFWAQHAGFELTGEMWVYGVNNDRLVTKTVAMSQQARDDFVDKGAATVNVPTDNQVSRRDSRDIWVLVPYQLL